MRISRKKKNNISSELVLQLEEPVTFDIWAVLAKSAFMTLILMGAVCGFLSAYEMEYNQVFFLLTTAALSLILSAVYGSRKRWLINVTLLAVFAIYIAYAFSNFWLINSGFYAILNGILATARSYLAVSSGTDYVLQVDNVYAAVTAFSVFISIISCLILSISLQRTIRLFWLLALTGLPLLIPFYFEKAPDAVYILLLLMSWVVAAALRANRSGEPGEELKSLLPLLAVFTLVVGAGGSFLGASSGFSATGFRTAAKTTTENGASGLVQYGLLSLFRRSSSGGGVSGGQLGRGDAVQPDYQTDLIVRYTPYSTGRVYLKAFTGMDYEGDCWTAAGVDGDGGNGGLAAETEARKRAYESDPETQGRGLFEVTNVGANTDYSYRPYFTDDAQTVTGSADEAVSGNVSTQEQSGAGESVFNGSVTTYTYYPNTGEVTVPAEAIDPADLTVPDACASVVADVCAEEGFSKDPEKAADEIVAYFARDFGYTLRPGYNFFQKDYITYFLRDSKKGYCAHFASAATMLFRELGIPARYVEGYAFSYNDILVDGTLEDGETYDDWYAGCSSLGRTGVISLPLSDAKAHGWVEIYIAGKGWTVVDPTPATQAEETDSFWDAFLRGNGNENNNAAGPGALGQAALRAVRGIGLGAVFVFVCISAGALLWFLIRRFRESRLPEREQVVLRYSRWARRESRRDPAFAVLRTIGEQLDYVRGSTEEKNAEDADVSELHKNLPASGRKGKGVAVSEEAEQQIYAAFFGPQKKGGACGAALDLVKQLGKILL